MHNIPVEVWLPRGYPREPPLVLVTPSPGVALRPTSHVDATGRVFHAHLAGWSTRPESSVVELLCVLAATLAAAVPFYPGAGRPTLHPPSPQPQPPETEAARLRTALQAWLDGRFRALQGSLAVESDRLLAENTQLSQHEAALRGGRERVLAEIAQIEAEIEVARAQRASLVELAEHGGDRAPHSGDGLVVPQGVRARQYPCALLRA